MNRRFDPPAREREGEKQSGGSGGNSSREREGGKQDDYGRRGGGGDDIIFVPVPGGDPYPYPYPSRQSREPGLTFARGGQIWEVGLSGRSIPMLVRGLPNGEARQPARSPVWGRLAFVAPPGELRWITAEGRKPRTLVKSDFGRIGQPVWSSDDKLVAFVSDRDGSDDIFIVGEKGGKPRVVAPHPASDHSPAFSSDRNWLYFVSDRSGTPALWQIHVSGNLNTLSQLQGLPPGEVVSVASTRSTPTLVVCIQERNRQKQLYLFTPYGRAEAVKISDGRGDDDQPALSPDGSRVAFRTAERNSHTIVVWNRRTNRAERLTDGPDDSHPTFW